jgi:hypothetical protein
VFLIRKQAWATAKAMSVQHIISTSVLFTVLCFSFFMGITLLVKKGEINNATMQTALYTMILSIVGTARLLVKAKYAEEIIEAVDTLFIIHPYIIRVIEVLKENRCISVSVICVGKAFSGFSADFTNVWLR